VDAAEVPGAWPLASSRQFREAKTRMPVTHSTEAESQQDVIDNSERSICSFSVLGGAEFGEFRRRALGIRAEASVSLGISIRGNLLADT
jgi:hypothetical protein